MPPLDGLTQVDHVYRFGSALLNARTARFFLLAVMMATTDNSFIDRKNVLRSKRFWGFAIVALEIAEILTGDPLSLNGYLKWILFLSGSGLWLWGEIVASMPLGFRMWREELR